VIEEAHRLLGNYGQENPYVGNTRGKAVETFTNILSEIRAYGEGFLIAEQIPMKLNLDVIKNTNLKVMHRVVAEDDRKIVGATMNIDERESDKVTSLNVGEAAVFSEGDDGPYHVKVPYSKIEAKKGEREKEDEAIRKIMVGFSDAKNLAPFEGCTKYCKVICKYKQIGGEVSSSYKYSSQIPILTIAFLDNLSSAESIFLQLMEMGVDQGNRVKDLKGLKICAAIQAFETYFEELGSGYNWLYEDVERLKTAFLDLIMGSLDKYMISPTEFNITSIDESKIQRFREVYFEVCRGKQPTQYCKEICVDETCFYRFNLKEALLDDYYSVRFIEIIEEGSDDMWSKLHDLCREAVQATILSDGSEDTTRRITLCYALHKCNSIKSFSSRHVSTIMRNLIDYNSGETKNVNGGTENVG
jgi:hypothetical protein